MCLAPLLGWCRFPNTLQCADCNPDDWPSTTWKTVFRYPITLCGTVIFTTTTVPEVWGNQDSSVGITTRYGLDGPRIESRWGARYSVSVANQPQGQWLPGTFQAWSGRVVVLTAHFVLVPGCERIAAMKLSPLLCLLWHVMGCPFFLIAAARTGPGPAHCRGFMITLRYTAHGRTLPDEWSVWRRDLFLTTHNTHKGRTSMPPAGFELTISASERPQTHALDSAVTGIGWDDLYFYLIFMRRLMTTNIF